MTPIRKSPIRGRLAYSARWLEPLHELLTRLGHFGCDHKLAVRLIRIPREVVLVIALGRIELVQRHNLRHDRIAEELFDVLDRRKRGLLLPGGV